MIEIRPPALSDLPGMYRVCFATSGETLASNPDLVGHVYAGAYFAQHPDVARVIADDLGVCGYVLGSPDTRAFETWCEENWWPPLRAQYPLGSGGLADAEMIRSFHRPAVSPESVVAKYPAHLHINLLPRTQGSGYGRRLIDWMCNELAASGISGVHLGVAPENSNAIAFYEHVGFATVRADDGVRWMARSL